MWCLHILWGSRILCFVILTVWFSYSRLPHGPKWLLEHQLPHPRKYKRKGRSGWGWRGRQGSWGQNSMCQLSPSLGGRKPISTYFLFFFYLLSFGQNLVKGPRLAAREAGKCSLLADVLSKVWVLLQRRKGSNRLWVLSVSLWYTLSIMIILLGSFWGSLC